MVQWREVGVSTPIRETVGSVAEEHVQEHYTRSALNFIDCSRRKTRKPANWCHGEFGGSEDNSTCTQEEQNSSGRSPRNMFTNIMPEARGISSIVRVGKRGNLEICVTENSADTARLDRYLQEKWMLNVL